jgi:glyoxylase-like metal-dependent hydrolase (beta-lactamase superfamily II)
VLGEELRPGLRTWTAHHEEWGQDVRGFAIVTDERLILVDPLLVGDQWEELAALREGRELDLLATLHFHVRSGAEAEERHPDATLWAFEGDREKIAERAPIDRTFAIGEELPGGLVAIGPLPREEVVFWDATRQALFAGDVLLGDGAEGEGLGLCPEPWLDGASLDTLRTDLAPVLELPVELVLTAHGTPVLSGGREALAAALA